MKFNEIREECLGTEKYSPKIAKFIKLIVTELDFVSILEDKLEEKVIWNKVEAIHTLLYVHLLCIRAYNLAQFYLSGIVMDDSEAIQLQRFIKGSGKKIYKNIKITE